MTWSCYFENFLCEDCGHNVYEMGELYMVHHDIWEYVTGGLMRVAHMLCVGCLEERLGRRLHYLDFMDVPLNDAKRRQSLRLRDRMTSPRLKSSTVIAVR